MPDVSEPAAIKKAESLAKFLGGKIPNTLVLLSDREAFEFLEWYEQRVDHDMLPEFQRDLASAKALHDPWPMLNGFTVMGFEIGRSAVETH